MLIQLNSDNNLTIHGEYRDKLTSWISGEFDRFADNITRIEVHLSDENGDKNSVNDKKCALEARIEGLKPVTVTDKGDTYDIAVSGAIDKLKNLLDTQFGKMRNY